MDTLPVRKILPTAEALVEAAVELVVEGLGDVGSWFERAYV